MPASAVSVSRQVRRGWVPPARDFKCWADAVLGPRMRARQVSVLLVGEQRSRTLNRHYRNRDKSTNVLSFPASPVARRSAGLLGDLVICPLVLRAEAREQHKDIRSHWAHMVVHGMLHLLGYDHERARDAQRMERREVRVLRQLGIGNPYISMDSRSMDKGAHGQG
ncbi:MAG TPA: rRNA maturation RNase YbeY [Steroidobacteraceae bacterium]|jgi:probable rRNA maturation factor|nr:rRNA maturation RNase YbeY [Steroidobacteraceae bacterium]